MNRRVTAVPCVIVLLSASAVSAASGLSVGEPFAIAPAPADQRDQVLPAVAFDGKETYLVAWAQGRDFHETESSDLFAARISAEGKLLDEKPVALCAAPDSQSGPRVAFQDGVFLVVWQDLRSGKDLDVYGVRVSADGKVLDPEGFLVAGGAHNQALPAVAPAADGFLVLWQDYRSARGYELFAAHVGADGKVRDEGGQRLEEKGKALQGGDVEAVWTGDAWFVFWNGMNGKGAAARVVEDRGRFSVASSNAPLPNYGGRMGGAAASGGKIFYSGSAIHGRGRNFRPCTGLLFGASSTSLLANPNEPVNGGTSGWAEKEMIGLHVPMPGVDPGPAPCALGSGFIVFAKGSSKEAAPYCNQILAGRVDLDGKRIDDPKAWPVIHDGTNAASAPACASGPAASCLVVYCEQHKDGSTRLTGRIVKSE